MGGVPTSAYLLLGAVDELVNVLCLLEHGLREPVELRRFHRFIAVKLGLQPCDGLAELGLFRGCVRECQFDGRA